jgi:hypothetical protein
MRPTPVKFLMMLMMCITKAGLQVDGLGVVLSLDVDTLVILEIVFLSCQ